MKGCKVRIRKWEVKIKKVLDWKIILSECGVDLTVGERVCMDRDVKKKCVTERMTNLEKCERQHGPYYIWGTNESMVYII